MEEMNNQNQNAKIEKAKKLKKKPIMGIVILCISAILLVSQVYASVNGFGNIFFMIKSIFSNEEIKGADNLFSDRDITISYSSIELAEGLKVQVQRLTVEENETTIYLYYRNENSKTNTPLKYKVYDKDNNLISESTGKTTEELVYTDLIKINKSIDIKSTLKLEIYDNEGNSFPEITIDLDRRELLIGNDKVDKLSEIELKKYLNAFSVLNYGLNSKEEHFYTVGTALQLANELKIKNLYSAGENLINKKILDELIDSFNFKKYNVDIKYVKGNNYYFPDEWFNNPIEGKCLGINNITFKNGIYTIEYFYVCGQRNENIENLAQYLSVIELKINENSEYSKYKIVSLSESECVKEKSNAVIENEPQPEQTQTLYGDVNLDGKVDESDRMYLNRYLDGWEGYELREQARINADVYADGKINMKDVAVLERHLADWDGYKTLPYEGTIENTENTTSENEKEPAKILYGDVNLDGEVNGLDVLRLAKYIDRQIELSDKEVINADLDVSNIIDENDLTILKRHVTGWQEYQKLPYKGTIENTENTTAENEKETIDKILSELREFINNEKEDIKTNDRLIGTDISRKEGTGTGKSRYRGINIFNIILDGIEENIVKVEEISPADWRIEKVKNQYDYSEIQTRYEFEDEFYLQDDTQRHRDMYVEYSSNNETLITISYWENTSNEEESRKIYKFTLNTSARETLEKIEQYVSNNSGLIRWF